MKTAKIFACGRDQAVRLPREFRFKGHEVRIRRFGLGVILEPATVELHTWFEARLNRLAKTISPSKSRLGKNPHGWIPSWTLF